MGHLHPPEAFLLPLVAHPPSMRIPRQPPSICTVTITIGLLSITTDSFEVPRLLQKWSHAVWTLFDLASFTERNGAEINRFCIYQRVCSFLFSLVLEFQVFSYSLTFSKPFFQTCQLHLGGGSARASSLPYFQTQKFHLNVLRKEISSKTS